MSSLADLGNLKFSSTQTSERFHYQFTDTNGNVFDISINAQNTIPDGIHSGSPNVFNPIIDSNNFQEISGSVNGNAIISGTGFASPDDLISDLYASSRNGAHDSVTGLDTHGISFTTSDGTSWNIAYTGSGTDSTVVSSAQVIYHGDGSPPTIGPTTQSFVDPSSFNLSLTPICYLPGTLITTTDGDVPVEELKIGDLLPTHSGKVLPVKWIGRQNIDGRFLPKEQHPVCFKTGSLGNGLPRRDLSVSFGHSMYVNNTLVIASLLVNGITVTQEKMERFELYQIDLGEHHAILAEGAYSETYAEYKRECFDNVAQFYELYPDHQAVEQVRYAPHIWSQEDPQLPAIIDSLLSFVPSTHITSDPDLHLLVDGQRVNPIELNANGRTSFTFLLPQTAKHVRLVSRKNRPLHIGQSNDLRELGFCVQELSAAYEGGHASVTFSAQHPKLEDNYYPASGANSANNKPERWTNGDAYVPVELMHLALKTQDPQTITTPIRLTIKGYGLGRYLLPKESTAIASEQQPANQASYALVVVSA